MHIRRSESKFIKSINPYPAIPGGKITAWCSHLETLLKFGLRKYFGRIVHENAL